MIGRVRRLSLSPPNGERAGVRGQAMPFLESFVLALMPAVAHQ
jgi:hypothetical protein